MINHSNKIEIRPNLLHKWKQLKWLFPKCRKQFLLNYSRIKMNIGAKTKKVATKRIWKSNGYIYSFENSNFWMYWCLEKQCPKPRKILSYPLSTNFQSFLIIKIYHNGVLANIHSSTIPIIFKSVKPISLSNFRKLDKNLKKIQFKFGALARWLHVKYI